MAKRTAQPQRLLVGNCLEKLKALDDNSIDSIVTDPPYELSFMGKTWDGSGIAYSVELWTECLRVLKPGGHLLAFGGTRTYHRMAVAIEDAGFEIRDSIHWLYGSGFPKSLDVSKAFDKAVGAEREVVQLGNSDGARRAPRAMAPGGASRTATGAITAPATDAAKQWQGWGTALKPAHEPIVVARKPLAGTVAANVLDHATGALNIDGCRVGLAEGEYPSQLGGGTFGGSFGNGKPAAKEGHAAGRWPANIVLTHAVRCGSDCDVACPIALLNAQSGVSKSSEGGGIRKGALGRMNDDGWQEKPTVQPGYGDTGGASRFFTVAEWDPTADAAPFLYVAKPGKKERNAAGENNHPTLKPVALMRHLVRLVTPPGGVVLDPFLGSGTTAVAAILEGFEWRGCEMTKDYLPIIKARTAWATKQRKAELAAAKRKAKAKQGKAKS